MAGRKIVSRDELNKTLTKALAEMLKEYEDCREAHWEIGFLLEEPYADGCNWSKGNVHPMTDNTPEQFHAIIDKIWEEARGRYNLSGQELSVG